MPSVTPNVSVIVPTLNEAENIEGIIRKIIAGSGALEIEIIVVDDASKDDTQPIVRRLSETLPVVLLARDQPKDGLAGAVLAGARAARANVVMVIDADGSHPPEKIPELAEPVIRGEKDMVIGSRYAPGGSTPGWSRKRRLMSRAASACAWPLTDVHDALSGFFAVRRELMVEIPSDAAGFKIALEILVRGGDSIRVGEVPIVFRDRELGQSKMGTRVIFTYFRRLLALSGWRESQDNVRAALQKTLLIWAADFLFFAGAAFIHTGLALANLIGFAAGASLNAWLKSAQLDPAVRTSPRFLTRLLFVSCLSFFLRSGILGTGAIALGWPWLVAILPAIIAGWAVLFLCYALFIWPVREQYGLGMRWRIAALGATAYLFALRAAYLFTIPIDPRLAVMPGYPGGLHAGNQISIDLRNFGEILFHGARAGINAPAMLCWVIVALAAFQITRRLFDKTTAFRALLLVSVLPAFVRPCTVFSPATVIITVWAVVLWLMSFALRWDPAPAIIACIAALLIFWLPTGWLPAWPLESKTSLTSFILWQFVLVTPMAILALATYPWSKVKQIAPLAAAICAAVALVFVFLGYMAGNVDVFASGAIWLPLLPVIAFQMQPPGRPPAPFWSITITTCIFAYGCIFYWLGFGWA
jgi:dolichol-phosphate mannosyltransferase